MVSRYVLIMFMFTWDSALAIGDFTCDFVNEHQMGENSATDMSAMHTCLKSRSLLQKPFTLNFARARDDIADSIAFVTGSATRSASAISRTSALFLFIIAGALLLFVFLYHLTSSKTVSAEAAETQFRARIAAEQVFAAEQRLADAIKSGDAGQVANAEHALALARQHKEETERLANEKQHQMTQWRDKALGLARANVETAQKRLVESNDRAQDLERRAEEAANEAAKLSWELRMAAEHAAVQQQQHMQQQHMQQHMQQHVQLQHMQQQHMQQQHMQQQHIQHLQQHVQQQQVQQQYGSTKMAQLEDAVRAANQRAAAAAKDAAEAREHARLAQARKHDADIEVDTVAQPTLHVEKDRRSQRVLIIGQGFGREVNPHQTAIVTQSGFQVYFCDSLPNPEQLLQQGQPLAPYLDQIMRDIGRVRPNLLMSGSKGGAYVVELWKLGYWQGPTLMINVHPTCAQLPKGLPIVLAHGSNDELYCRRRGHLEELVRTGSENMCFLYYTGNSGQVAGGGFARTADRHNMVSLLEYDCLPRLMESALSTEGPELHFMRTWSCRLCQQRIAAETWLGYKLQRLQRLWVSSKDSPRGGLYSVAPGSDEYECVKAVFKSRLPEPPAYPEGAAWQSAVLLQVERVENWPQGKGIASYYDSLKSSIESQAVPFEPGIHTRWGFHGSDAVESIVSNPVAGFQPLTSGSNTGAIWGPGTYFARDAHYCLNGTFCKPGPDGQRRMLMCLLMTGMPCVGDPQHKGVLPIRNNPHRYDSAVDWLASPEVFVLQYANAAYPAYLLTFR